MDRTSLYNAFRQAGAATRGTWRAHKLEQVGVPPTCPFSARRLDATNSLVHHEEPLSLHQLIFLFLSQEQMTREDVELDEQGQLRCENLRARWVVFYKCRSRLTLVHKSVDLMGLKRGVVHWAALHPGPTVVVGREEMGRLEKAGRVRSIECRISEWGADRRPLGWHVPVVFIESPPAPRKPKPKPRAAPVASSEVA